MTNEVQTIKIGGVEYSKQEVASAKEITQERTNSKGVWEQYKEYKVTLKDGTVLKYSEQDAKRQASVDILDDGSVNFYGLTNAEITDTEKNDTYRLMGCEFTKVEAKRTEFGFNGIIPTNDKGADRDKIEQYNRELENGGLQKPRDNKVRINQGDRVGYGFGRIHD